MLFYCHTFFQTFYTLFKFYSAFLCELSKFYIQVCNFILNFISFRTKFRLLQFGYLTLKITTVKILNKFFKGPQLKKYYIYLKIVKDVYVGLLIPTNTFIFCLKKKN